MLYIIENKQNTVFLCVGDIIESQVLLCGMLHGT